MSKKTILVTGATGFLGSHLVSQLLRDRYDVVALCREDEPELGDLGVEVRRGDILDAPALENAAKGCDVLIHCAGRVSRDPRDAEELYQLHVTGTKLVLDAARKAGITRAVVTSTSGTVAVSDDPDHVADEEDETPLAIVSRWPYYRSKLFAERAALEKNALGFEVVSINPSLLLGPGDLRRSSTEDVRLFLERRIPAIPPGGLSFVDVRDAADALVRAIRHGRGGERYLIGAANMTLRTFFGRLARISGVRAPWLPMPRTPEYARVGARAIERWAGRLGVPAPVDPVSLDMAHFTWYVDASKAERELGWRPRDPMTTLADTVADLRRRGAVWPMSETSRQLEA